MSSPPSPLPPTRYFDLLPTELLRTIFNDLDEAPRTRRIEVTLLSLCLTSKLCRSLAQPLLLKRVQIQLVARDPTEAQKKAEQGLLEKLVDNNSDQALAAIEVFLFNKPKHKNVSKWLKKLIQKATSLREVLVVDELVAFKAFIGCNITELSLVSVSMRLDQVFHFPELLYLSMTICSINKEGGIRLDLPKLRHLGFFQYRTDLSPQEANFIDQVAPSLVSLTIQLPNKPSLPASILRSPSISVLFYFWTGQDPAPTLEGVRHLHLSLMRRNQDFPIESKQQELNKLQTWTTLIRNSNHQLETLTIASDPRGGGPRPEAQVLLPALVAACQSQRVEVIWEEEGSGSRTFDDLVSATFVKRAEDRYQKVKAAGTSGEPEHR